MCLLFIALKNFVLKIVSKIEIVGLSNNIISIDIFGN